MLKSGNMSAFFFGGGGAPRMCVRLYLKVMVEKM